MCRFKHCRICKIAMLNPHAWHRHIIWNLTTLHKTYTNRKTWGSKKLSGAIKPQRHLRAYIHPYTCVQTHFIPEPPLFSLLSFPYSIREIASEKRAEEERRRKNVCCSTKVQEASNMPHFFLRPPFLLFEIERRRKKPYLYFLCLIRGFLSSDWGKRIPRIRNNFFDLSKKRA